MGEGLGRTVGRIFKSARGWAEGLAPSLPHDQPEPADALVEMGGFGSNPGRLRMLAYVPARLAARPALVVVLHGCTQSAADYVRGAGWLTLADRFGFALLCPEQRRLNNPRLCFNWFLPDDTTRDQGEPLSIRQMVHTMVARFGLVGERVFVTGLSAGGAMTSVLLATYPDVFAGGAIIAGLPYGCAHNAHEALRAMFEGQDRPAREWGDLVRAASPHHGPWPKVSVWHGSADATVNPLNAGEIVKQWADVHGLSAAAGSDETSARLARRVWRNAAREEVLESYSIADMGHGTPLGLGPAEDPLGIVGPFLFDVGIGSSRHIAEFWGVADLVGAAPPSGKARETGAGRKAADWQPHRTRPALQVGGALAKALKALFSS